MVERLQSLLHVQCRAKGGVGFCCRTALNRCSKDRQGGIADELVNGGALGVECFHDFREVAIQAFNQGLGSAGGGHRLGVGREATDIADQDHHFGELPAEKPIGFFRLARDFRRHGRGEIAAQAAFQPSAGQLQPDRGLAAAHRSGCHRAH